MKFKVGDKIVGTDLVGNIKYNQIGIITQVSENYQSYSYKFKGKIVQMDAVLLEQFAYLIEVDGNNILKDILL